MNEATILQLPTDEYRTLPIPYSSHRKRQLKMANFYVKAEDLPPQLENWMDINPRVPKHNKKGNLTGVVARAIKSTLIEEPDKFVLKNQGIYILAKQVEFEKAKGGQGFASIHLQDPLVHGLVNGGHTFLAIRQVAESEDCPSPWDAYVRLHVIEIDVADADDIPEIAEGLNRSLQVDDPSLENLKGTFNSIKQHLEGKLGADQVAYRQGDSGEVDIQHVLMHLAVFNLEQFPDRRTHPDRRPNPNTLFGHPNTLFGHPKRVLQIFMKDQDSKEGDRIFDRIIPRTHEILILSDYIQKETAPKFALMKAKNTKRSNRGGSKSNKGRKAHFAGGTIGGEVALGWLYPMLAALRANVSYEAWLQGKFEWSMDPKELLDETIGEMVQLVKEEHKANISRPAEVGRKEAAYRGCYGAVSLMLAQRGLFQ